MNYKEVKASENYFLQIKKSNRNGDENVENYFKFKQFKTFSIKYAFINNTMIEHKEQKKNLIKNVIKVCKKPK